MVTIISFQDYSRVGKLYADSLNSVGCESRSMALSGHPYGYKNRTRNVLPEQMDKYCRESDVVIIMHSRHELLKYVKHRPFFVMHGGTRYRQAPERVSELFKDAQGAIIQTPDLLRIGTNKKERLIMCPIEETIHPIPFVHVKYKFGHYPSNPMTKGTEQIKRMFDTLNITDYKIDTTLKPHEDNMKRIGQSAVYVELFKPLQNDKLYGSFGVTALEAALLGRPVITMCANYQDYLDEYNMDAFEISNNESDFMESLRDISMMNLDALNHWGNTCRQLVLERHSLQVIGNKLKEFIK